MCYIEFKVFDVFQRVKALTTTPANHVHPEKLRMFHVFLIRKSALVQGSKQCVSLGNADLSRV